MTADLDIPTTSSGERDVRADLADALTALTEAQDDYETAEEYQRGRVQEKFITDRLRRMLTGSEFDFQVNFAGRVIGAVMDRLEVAAVTAEPDTADNTTTGPTGGDTPEGESPEESEADLVLNELVWHANDMDIEAPEVHSKTLALGDAYLFAWPKLDDNGATVGVDLFYNSPGTVRILYDEEHPRTKRLAIKRWTTGMGKDRRVRVNLYYPGTPGEVRKLISKGRTKGQKAADFEAHRDEHTDGDGVLVFPWDWEDLPFFHFRTSRPYGVPEHEQAYGAQDAVTKLVANLMSAVDFAVFPQRFGLIEQGAATDDDTDWGDEAADDAADPGDHESQLTSAPGTLWPLRHFKEVGEFAPAQVSQFLEPLNWFTEAMGAVTGTPVSYFQPLTGEHNSTASGESQRQGEAPLLSKINARQRSFAAAWREALGFALRLLGVEATATVRWKPPQVLKTKEEWEAVKAKQDAGVPVRQSLLEVGYTEAEVDSWGFTEDNPDGPGQDMSAFGNPPPVPGTANPFAQQQALAPPPAPGGGES